jgi:hypothetical protein
MLVLSFIVSEKNRKQRWTMYWRFDLKIREQFIVSAFSLTVFIQKKMKKKEFSPSLQVVFSIVDHSQFEI